MNAGKFASAKRNIAVRVDRAIYNSTLNHARTHADQVRIIRAAVVKAGFGAKAKHADINAFLKLQLGLLPASSAETVLYKLAMGSM